MARVVRSRPSHLRGPPVLHGMEVWLRTWLSDRLEAVESAIRRSWLARFLPHLRERSPLLHRLLLAARDSLFPYRSRFNVTRYQYRAIRRFQSLEAAAGGAGPILEIGSDESGAVLGHLASISAAHVVGINPRVSPPDRATQAGLPGTAALVQGDARYLPFAPASIHHVFSVATLEHILDLPRALRECHRVLAPGGYFYADFGPIWSSSIGHHVYARVGDEEARHWKPGKNPVPNHAHLLLTRQELRVRLTGRVSPALLDAILEWIYDRQDINRMFFDDYVRAVQDSPFELLSLTPLREHVDGRTLAALRARFPDQTDFSCRMVELVLRKRE